MHSSLLALAASLSVAAAVNRGFNYGAVTRDGAVKNEASFTAEFKAAKGLADTDGAFSSARLYTMIQAGTTSDPISAIPAAISTNTRLFLGLWASSGQTIIDNEIAALQAAISQYGDDFTSRINGISVGSEDLYRISPTGLLNDPLSVGAQPAQIVSYIKQVKSALSDAGLTIPVGHVDTWDVWRNGSNSAVVAASDFLGMNTFPYFQTTQENSINNAPQLFNDAYDITVAAANGKPVLVTETGWPVSGKNSASADPSPENARSYYEAVGCNTLFGNIDTYWYTLVDANTDTANQPQFGVVGTTVSTTPLFNLSCDATNSTSTSSSSRSGSTTASSTRTSSASATGSMSILPITTSSTISLAPEASRPAGTSGLAGGNQTATTGTGNDSTATGTVTGTDTPTDSPSLPSPTTTVVSEPQSTSMTGGSDTQPEPTEDPAAPTVYSTTIVPTPSPTPQPVDSNPVSSTGPSATSSDFSGAASQMKACTFVAFFGAVAALFVLV